MPIHLAAARAVVRHIRPRFIAFALVLAPILIAACNTGGGRPGY